MSRMIDADALMETLEAVYWARENESKYTGNRAITVTWNDAIVTIKSAPTIHPERKKGKWQVVSADRYIYRCDVCEKNTFGMSDWCPNCGADMRGEE